jgi:hypothetical protein
MCALFAQDFQGRFFPEKVFCQTDVLKVLFKYFYLFVCTLMAAGSHCLSVPARAVLSHTGTLQDLAIKSSLILRLLGH